MSKKNKAIMVACSEDVVAMVDEVIKLQSLPPSRSLVGMLFIVDGADKVIRGEVTLESLYRKYSLGALAGLGR